MSARAAVGAIAIGMVLLLGLALPAVRPDSAADYRETAVTAAQETLSALRTVTLAARADLAGKELSPHLTVVVDTSRDAAASAVHELAAADVPDEPSRALRDQLSPLLLAAVTAIGAAGAALDTHDKAGVRASTDSLTALADRLAEFVESQR